MIPFLSINLIIFTAHTEIPDKRIETRKSIQKLNTFLIVQYLKTIH